MINGREKGVSLFSLPVFSITKNCPRMNDTYVPVNHSTLVPARMGRTQLGVTSTALPYLAPDTGQERQSSLVVADTLAIRIIKDIRETMQEEA